jgi:hypothetical protein
VASIVNTWRPRTAVRVRWRADIRRIRLSPDASQFKRNGVQCRQSLRPPPGSPWILEVPRLGREKIADGNVWPGLKSGANSGLMLNILVVQLRRHLPRVLCA